GRAGHFAGRAVEDALAVGRRAALVPVDVVDQSVDVLEELPREAALARSRLARDRDEPQASLATSRVEEVLQQAKLLVAPHERRLEAFRATNTTELCHNALCPPGR